MRGARLKARGRAKRGARAPWERRRGTRVTSGGRNSRGYLLKRKHMLIKVNVPGGEHTVGDGIIAPISLGVGGVADEDASDRTGCEFVRSGIGSARIAKAPENTQAIIRWGRTEEKMVRCIVPPWAARAKVKEKRSSSECVRPETRRHVSMEQERANAAFRVQRTRSS